MKSLHRNDLYGWSAFDNSRNVDFSGTFWVCAGGNVAIDPMELSEHDQAHVAELGGLSWILITNADHVRDTAVLAQRYGSRIGAPDAEREDPRLQDLNISQWIEPDQVLDCGIRCIALAGSKGLAGELAFLLPDGDTLVCGDLIRGQKAGNLNLLPDPKLTDKPAALASVRRLLELPALEAIIVGDGQSIFRDGRSRLEEMLARQD